MSYINLPVLDIDFMKVRGLSFDTKGGAQTGGRNGLGESAARDITGGGVLTGRYDFLAQSPEEHDYVNWLGAYCNSRTRFINVPILSDWSKLFPIVRGLRSPFLEPLPHSDGSFFSDGTGYREARMFGTFPYGANLFAGQIVVNVYGGEEKLGRSAWFSTYHDVKGWRAYRYWEYSYPVAVSETIDGVVYNGFRYTLAVDRPMRQAVPAGQRIEFSRPLCVMKFPDDFTLPFEMSGYYEATPTVQFTEAQ